MRTTALLLAALLACPALADDAPKADLALRNGISLHAPLRAVGPFDLLLRVGDDEVFVPIHAVLSWSVETP